MSDRNGDDLYENKLERIYSEIRRLDELRISDNAASKELINEKVKRLDERMNGQEVAVTTALSSAEKAVAAALVGSEKAVDKAEIAQAKVNEGQNEFRGTLRDQAQTLMPRQETENLVRELRGLLSGNASQLTELRSRIDVGPPSLSTLQGESDRNAGRRAGSLDTRTLVFGLIAAFGTIVGLVGIVLAFAH